MITFLSLARMAYLLLYCDGHFQTLTAIISQKPYRSKAPPGRYFVYTPPAGSFPYIARAYAGFSPYITRFVLYINNTWTVPIAYDHACTICQQQMKNSNDACLEGHRDTLNRWGLFCCCVQPSTPRDVVLHFLVLFGTFSPTSWHLL